jgi:hypothetical protein
MKPGTLPEMKIRRHLAIMCGILLMTRDAQRLEERASLMLHEDVARYVLSNSHHDDVEKLSGHESGISA